MRALAEIQVIPIGVGVSVRREVIRAHDAAVRPLFLYLALAAVHSPLQATPELLARVDAVRGALGEAHARVDVARRGPAPQLLHAALLLLGVALLGIALLLIALGLYIACWGALHNNVCVLQGACFDTVDFVALQIDYSECHKHKCERLQPV